MNQRTLAPEEAMVRAYSGAAEEAEGVSRGTKASASPLGEIRRANLSLASETIYRLGPITRQDLIEETGLSRVTVLELVTELQEAGVIQVRVPKKGHNGRPPALLEMDETRLMVGALEINLGHIALSTATLAGTVLSTQRRTLDPGKSGPEEVLRIAAEMLNSAEGAPECGGRKLVHVAVACLAIVDTQHGKILKSSSLGWGKVDIAEELTRLTRSTITYSIDRLANFAVIAERRHGRWSDDAEILLLYGDIGIGGAYQHRADVFHSDHGFGANVGHLTVEFDGRPCYCGRRGCLETYVGIGPLANALDHVQDRPTNSPQVPLEKTLKAARQGIPEVIEELERQGKWLARGVELMRAAFDPAVVVIGGALAELAPLMRQSFQKEIARLAADSGQATAIETSSLGREAVLQGALASAVETVAREPWRSGFSGFRGK